MLGFSCLSWRSIQSAQSDRLYPLESKEFLKVADSAFRTLMAVALELAGFPVSIRAEVVSIKSFIRRRLCALET